MQDGRQRLVILIVILPPIAAGVWVLLRQNIVGIGDVRVEGEITKELQDMINLDFFWMAVI